MKLAIVILARKNSKRIKRKNFKDFCGKPLIHYTLDDASKLGYPVYFYSDCKIMRHYAKYFDVNISVKPKKFGLDKHNTKAELTEYNKKIKADVLVLLQPTSPIRDVELMKGWITDFLHYCLDSGISVYRMPNKYYYDNSKPLNFDQKERDYNGCKREPIYMENGAFYIFNKKMLNEKHLIGKKNVIYLDKYGIDLDHEFQWKQTEQIYKQIRNIE